MYARKWRCGDLIEALFTAAGVEPELGDAVAEGQRRHREGARFTVGRIQELGGLRGDLPPKHAQALFALSTNHEAWRELTQGHHLGWDAAEARSVRALAPRQGTVVASGAKQAGVPPDVRSKRRVWGAPLGVSG